MQKFNQRCPFNRPDDFYTYYTSTYGWRRLSKIMWIARTDTILVYHYSICKKLSCVLFFVDHADNQKQSWECLSLKSTFALMSSFQIQVYLKWVCIHIYVWISSVVSSLAVMQTWWFRTTEATAEPQRSLSEDKGMLSMTNSFPSFPSMPFPPTSEWRRSSPFHSLSTQHIFIMFKTSE